MHESESEVVQSCLTLSDPMDCSLSGSSIHGILQARVLEWIAITFSGTKREMRSILLFTLLKFVEIPFCYLGFIPFFFLYIHFSGYQEGRGMNHYPEREIDIWVERQIFLFLKKSRWFERDAFILIKRKLIPLKKEGRSDFNKVLNIFIRSKLIFISALHLLVCPK